METFCPLEELATKDFDEAKKRKYRLTIERQLRKAADGKPFDAVGAFKTMVKSGETQYSDVLFVDDQGFLQNQDSRPRNISVPSALGCGMLTMIQTLLWTHLKGFLPQFIQGMTKDDTIGLFQSWVTEDMYSLSMDGSAFDSTQHKILQEMVDVKFWSMIKPFLIKGLSRSTKLVNLVRGNVEFLVD